jgi:hypothetical protein
MDDLTIIREALDQYVSNLEVHVSDYVCAEERVKLHHAERLLNRLNADVLESVGVSVTVDGQELIPERIECLNGILDTAVEHNGYGFFYIYTDGRDDPEPYILAIDKEDEGEDWPKTILIDLNTIRKGLDVINRSTMQVDPKDPNAGPVLHNIDTGERLYLSPDIRKQLMLCNISNGEYGDYDVIGALAVVECGLFGKVVYA